jgi:D-ribose pyranase
MFRQGILNPQILSLLARVRHTNMLVIADRGFPFWPMIETVDISLVDDVPTVLQTLRAIRENFDVTEVIMAAEFKKENPLRVQEEFISVAGIPITFEQHEDMKKLVPRAIGLIRTGDTTQYANMILVSGRPEE